MHDKKTYCLGNLNPDILSKIQTNVLDYIGHKYYDQLANTFNGVVLPTRILTVDQVWKDHNHYESPIAVINSYDNNAVLCGTNNFDGDNIEYIDIKDIAESYLNEDQYHFATRKMIDKQTCFRASFNKSKSFGGISECNNGDVIKLKKDLIAHDNTTVIPKGSVVKIVDNDEAGLPDIAFNGSIINVDWDNLYDNYEYVVKEESDEFNTKLDKVFGIISFVQPNILLTVNKKLRNR